MNDLPDDYRRLSQRLPLLKGLAILAIVSYHVWGGTRGYPAVGEIVSAALNGGIKGIVEGILNFACLLGQQGVHIFLIASGFGLTASWYRKQQQHPDRNGSDFPIVPFWRRRLSRIIPLFWGAVVLALFMYAIDPGWAVYGQEVWHKPLANAIAAIVATLTTLRNFYFPYYSFLNGAWWYIGLSVQLYLIFPWLVKFACQKGWSKLLLYSTIISLVYRSLVVALPLASRPTELLLRGAFFPSRLFEFILGMALAIALLQDPTSPRRDRPLHSLKSLLLNPRFIAIPLCLFILGNLGHFAFSEGWEILRIPADAAIGMGELGLGFQLSGWLSGWRLGLGILGNFSYGIYLTHMNLQLPLWQAGVVLIPSYWLRWAVVILLACLFGIGFEISFHRLRRLFGEAPSSG